jgi:LPPG:FO 2-phospho-L-lactate transferase
MGRVAVLCGGVGAARLLTGLVQVVAPDALTAIANVGDDLVLHGLHVSPDLDTITYTVAGEVSAERGWGLEGESWQAMDMLRHYGGEAWFGLGDRDLGTHLFRTELLRRGLPLSSVTARIAAAWALPLRLLPVTDDPVRTMVTVADDGEIGFQEYFVGRAHAVEVSAIRFDGADTARPAPGVLDALDAASSIVIAPSNPLVSVAPVLAVPGLAERLRVHRDRVVAVSPLIGGKALKGPADRLMAEQGLRPDAVGVAEYYRELAATLVLDELDAHLASEVEALGVRAVVGPTIMRGPAEARALAELVLGG